MSFSPLSFFRAPAVENITCSVSELALFTRQLSVMMMSGIPLVASLDSLSRGEDQLSERVVPIMARRISQGHRLSSALRGFPRLFPSAYVWLIHGGEETGALHRNLEHLADWLERQDRLSRQLRKALTYPVLVCLTTFILTVALFRSVIPSILDAILGMGASLPAPTRALVAAVNIVQSPWTWLVAALLTTAAVGYLRSEKGRRSLGVFLLSAPLLGDLLRSAASARMALTLSMLLESGSEVTRAVAIAGSASGLPQMAADVERIRAELREGHTLSQAYNYPALYPPLICDMLTAGEESGRMTKMLRHASKLFEEDTYSRLESLTNLLEPLALAAISLGVGFILVSVILPMSTMLESL